METERVYGFWDWVLVKPLRDFIKKKRNYDILTEDEVKRVRQKLFDIFSDLIEYLAKECKNPADSRDIVLAFRNILIPIIIAISFRNIDYYGQDGIKALLNIMVEEIDDEVDLGRIKKDVSNFTDEINENILDLIVKSRNDAPLSDDKEFEFKGIAFKGITTKVSSKKKGLKS